MVISKQKISLIQMILVCMCVLGVKAKQKMMSKQELQCEKQYVCSRMRNEILKAN